MVSGRLQGKKERCRKRQARNNSTSVQRPAVHNKREKGKRDHAIDMVENLPSMTLKALSATRDDASGTEDGDVRTTLVETFWGDTVVVMVGKVGFGRRCLELLLRFLVGLTGLGSCGFNEVTKEMLVSIRDRAGDGRGELGGGGCERYAVMNESSCALNLDEGSKSGRVPPSIVRTDSIVGSTDFKDRLSAPVEDCTKVGEGGRVRSAAQTTRHAMVSEGEYTSTCAS